MKSILSLGSHPPYLTSFSHQMRTKKAFFSPRFSPLVSKRIRRVSFPLYFSSPLLFYRTHLCDGPDFAKVSPRICLSLHGGGLGNLGDLTRCAHSNVDCRDDFSDFLIASF